METYPRHRGIPVRRTSTTPSRRPTASASQIWSPRGLLRSHDSQPGPAEPRRSETGQKRGHRAGVSWIRPCRCFQRALWFRNAGLEWTVQTCSDRSDMILRLENSFSHVDVSGPPAFSSTSAPIWGETGVGTPTCHQSHASTVDSGRVGQDCKFVWARTTGSTCLELGRA